MDEPGARAAARDCHLECVDDELGLQVGAHRPADDPPRVAVHHRGEVEPALPAAHVLDVRAPEPIRSSGNELTLDEVVGDPDAGNADRCPPVALRHQTRKQLAPHQPLHPFATDPDLA
jgi:hypothetical protein